jgi:hypothetical protein
MASGFSPDDSIVVIATQRVRLVARLGQFDLFLPFTRTGAGLLAQGIPAMRATDPRNVVLGKTVSR